MHARARLQERGIRERLVHETLRHPEQVVELGGGQKVYHRRHRDKKQQKEYLVRVFVEMRHATMRVRSVYRTSKIHKYWRVP